MDISVKFSNNKFELSFDACKAKLSTAELLVLRQKLAEQLLTAWQKPAGFWEERQTELDELKYLVHGLALLDEDSLETMMINTTECGWVQLLDFTHLEAPNLAISIEKVIKNKSQKKYDLFFESAEEFANYLHLKPTDSILDVIKSLKQLEKKLLEYDPKFINLLVEQKTTPTQAQPAYNDKAFSFLDYLGGLPASNLRLILKRLSREDLGVLFSTCKMLKAVKLFEQLKVIFPEKLFQQFNNNCPAKVEEHEVRSLLAKINHEFKALKELLNARKKQ